MDSRVYGNDKACERQRAARVRGNDKLSLVSANAREPVVVHRADDININNVSDRLVFNRQDNDDPVDLRRFLTAPADPDVARRPPVRLF